MPTYHVNTNTVDDFGPGNEVRFIPIWANGDASYRDCENGVVHSVGNKSVFVRYYEKETGKLAEPRATDPKDLINMSEA